VPPFRTVRVLEAIAGTAVSILGTGFGSVYRVGSVRDMLQLAHAEGGMVYQAHPRTKGSTGFPAQIRGSEQLLDPAYFGAGWKAMNVDLSSKRMGDHVFRVLDDLNNWGLQERMMGEVDLFQIDSTHELYGHMLTTSAWIRCPTIIRKGSPRFNAVSSSFRRGQALTRPSRRGRGSRGALLSGRYVPAAARRTGSGRRRGRTHGGSAARRAPQFATNDVSISAKARG
jgi:hypothetical protein